MLIAIEHDLLTKFLKMKPPTFYGTEFEKDFEFIIDYYKSLHNMSIVQLDRVEFFSIRESC